MTRRDPKPTDLTERLAHYRKPVSAPATSSSAKPTKSAKPATSKTNSTPEERPLTFDPFSFGLWSALSLTLLAQLFILVVTAKA